VLTLQHQALMLGNSKVDNATKHGLVYDLKTDMFVPIKDKK